MNDLQQITRALAYASQSYSHGPIDPIGQPLIHHLITVLDELVQSGVTDTVTLVSGVLHDVTLYSDKTTDDIATEFGPEVAVLVAELSYELPQSNEGKQALQLDLIGRAHELSQAAQDITLADLTSNFKGHMFESDSTEFIKRKRIAWANTIAEELATPNPLLMSNYKIEVFGYTLGNELPENESYWDFVESEDVSDDIE